MAEEIDSPSSQEGLPLSQGTLAILMNQWNQSQLNEFHNISSFDNTTDCVTGQEIYTSVMEQAQEFALNVQMPQQTLHNPNYAHRAPSSLPASENWPGDYSFNVSFPSLAEATKKSPWTYSCVKDKLFVRKDVLCPFNFTTSAPMPNDVIIRAKVLYSCAEHASEVVHRCVNHSVEELTKGVFEAEHLIRCQSTLAVYCVDATTGRHSVVVPYQNPEVLGGQLFSTYIYKFVCFSSCSGGPNRRPLYLLFTLEKGSEVIGRRKIDLKICACPSRDRNAEEEHEKNKSLKRKQNSDDPSDSLPPTKKSKDGKNDGSSTYVLEIEDFECYQFLKQVMKKFEMYKILRTYFQ